jgi:hypothetical protein
MNRLHILVFFIIIVSFEVLTAGAIRTNAIVVDEFAHLPAGVAYWRDGLFSMYDENPPFVRYLISAPAFACGAKMDYSRAGTTRRWEWAVGHDFRRANRNRCGIYFVAGRTIVASLSVGCGLLILLWSKQLNGLSAALVCSTLWFLDPNVIAHSSIATTDIGTAALILFASFFFWRYLRRPNPLDAVVAGVGLGLALGSKFSAVVIFPVWITDVIFRKWQASRDDTRARPRVLDLVAIVVIALAVLNCLYKLHGMFTPLGNYAFISPTLSGLDIPSANGEITGNRFFGTWLGRLPLPLPRDYLLGLDSQMFDQQVGKFGDLENGRLVQSGRWYAPLRTLVYKLPVGSLAFTCFALAYWFLQVYRRCFPEVIIVAIPVLLIVLLCAEGGGLKVAFRYSLPALPFLFILMARPIQYALSSGKVGRIAVAVCLLWNIVSLVRTSPSYLAYGNEIVGGHDGAQRTFLGSNFDWGQDLLLLKQWADSHPDLGPIAFTYYGPLHPAEVGLKTRPLPLQFEQPDISPSTMPHEGFYWVVSSNVLHGLPGLLSIDGSTTMEGILRHEWLRKENAIARVGQTLFVFRIHSDDGIGHPGHTTVGLLKGCIKRINPDDFIGSP